MIREILMEEGIEKGLQQGLQKGLQQGLQQGNRQLLSRLLIKKFHIGSEETNVLLEGLRIEDTMELGEYILDCSSFDEIAQWVYQRKQGNLS